MRDEYYHGRWIRSAIRERLEVGFEQNGAGSEHPPTARSGTRKGIAAKLALGPKLPVVFLLLGGDQRVLGSPETLKPAFDAFPQRKGCQTSRAGNTIAYVAFAIRGYGGTHVSDKFCGCRPSGVLLSE